MLNVLVNAYAVRPHWGSEPGMGWNWVINLARYCRLYVITEGEWQEEIEAELETLPQRENITFYYIPMPEKVRSMCWNQGDWRFYFYYRSWQQKALACTRGIVSQHPIDLIHQLNMIGYREPGFLWQVADIPFVWGPVGGTELMPGAYLAGAGWKQRCFFGVKNIINALQRKYHTRVRQAIRRADVLVAAVKDVQVMMGDYDNREAVLMNETGTCGLSPVRERAWHTDGEFDILWVGKFDFRKQLGLAIQAVAVAKNPKLRLHICGEGSERQELYYREMTEQYGVAGQCSWYGNVKQDEVVQKMQDCDMLLFTSIMEATSTVVMEAIDAGLPILSFDTCGFGALVKAFAGKTVELTTPEQSVEDFAREINRFEAHRELLQAISEQELAQRDSLSWDSKVRRMVELYHEAVRKRKEGAGC